MALGMDLILIDRMKSLIQRKGLGFVQRMLGTEESSPQTLAGIFAAKEALGKALGTGITKTLLQQARVIKPANGKPYILYNHRLYEVSIAHDGPFAMAVVKDEGRVFPDPEMIRRLPKRNPKGNKKDFGRLALLGGCLSMVGCMALAAEAGLRTGAGYVHLYVPEEIQSILQIKTTEAIVHSMKDCSELGKYEALAMGPGMLEPIQGLMEELERRDLPVVVDADGLRWLKASKDIPKKLILTPHHGEAARLLDVSIEEIHRNPFDYAKRISERYDCVCVLKGAPTYVVYLDKTYENKTGNEGMGTAGSGDVLTGMIGALLCGGANLWDAAIAGVYFHGLAGDEMARIVGRRSLKAGHIVEGLGLVFREVEKWIDENEK